MTLDQRLAPALSVAPEIASMNMGSFNFNISAAAEKRIRVALQTGSGRT